MKGKLYKAKIDLPGCHKDRVIVGDSKTYRYQDNLKLCPYICADEPKFFEEIKEPKYKKGTTVILHDARSVVICDLNGKKTRSNFTLPAFTELTICGEITDNTSTWLILKMSSLYYYLVSDKVVHKPDCYFYVSSKGIVHKAWKGRDRQADKFRASVNNMHINKGAADDYIVDLRNKMVI